MMLGAFIVSTHDTYLHSWGSIFVQDVLMPFRKRPFTKRGAHLKDPAPVDPRGGGASSSSSPWLVPQNEYIRLFFAITGAIFAGGSGAVIIGGLYWRRGTTTRRLVGPRR